MRVEYTITCPVCGRSNRRSDDRRMAFHNVDGGYPGLYGSAVWYNEHIIDGNTLKSTGRRVVTTIRCPGCGYPEDEYNEEGYTEDKEGNTTIKDSGQEGSTSPPRQYHVGEDT